jgi:Fe-S cluster assembly scaffold protein SufB
MLEDSFSKTVFTKLFHHPSPERAKAFSEFQKLALPTSTQEEWKYTDLTQSQFAECALPQKITPKTVLENVTMEEKEFKNGAATDKFSAYTHAFANSFVFRVPAGKKARLHSLVHLKSSGALVQEIVVEENAQLDFFEEYQSSEKPILFGQKTVFRLAPDAVLNYYSTQRFSFDTQSFVEKEFHLSENAVVNCTHADVGASLSRTILQQFFEGNGSCAPHTQAVFFGSNNQHFDFTTKAIHLAQRTQSDILVKGALKEKASAVYRGEIRIAKNARGTDSFLHDHVLHLNKGVQSNSIPSLFIDNNEVKASHGATVTKLNPETLFYLESRGLNPKQSQRLVVEGFLQEIIDSIPEKGVKENILRDFESKID